MKNIVENKRVIIFLAIAFTIAWGAALAIYLTGGLVESPMIFPEVGFSLAYILMATVVMWAPAIAHLLTRLITKEGWQNVGLKPRHPGAGRYWILAWVLPGLLTIAGAVAYYLILPQDYDPKLTLLQDQLKAANQAAGVETPIMINPWLIIFIQAVQAMLIAPVLNALSTFGEEFGWRAYLLPKLLPLGIRKAVILSGVIWGAWHWPLILMGYNYGFDYPGAPWSGLLGMVWFTIGLGIILSWLTLRSGSVWPAVIAHGAINGIAAIGSLALAGKTNPLLGPTPVGLIGGLFFTVLAINLLFHPTALQIQPINTVPALEIPDS